MARLKVMQLHDCMERFRMFRAFDPKDEQLPQFERQAEELKNRLQQNKHFSQLAEPLKKTLLNGERFSILTHDEILERMGKFDSGTRGLYRFLSSHAHSFPLAFYRMAEQGRGRGEESDYEKRYIAAMLAFCTEVLDTSTDGFQKSFASIRFAGLSFDLNVLQNDSSSERPVE